jgi:hypothetical protein
VSRRGEVKEMAQAIIEHNDGQAYFNIQEASKIVGCGRNTLIAGLTDAGISVKRVGPSKRVSAYDLAIYMCIDRVAPHYSNRR